MNAANHLILLGKSLENGNQPLQAIRCYEAALQVPTLSLSSQVECRLHIALLLLQHTHNLFHAKTQLEKAQHVCQQRKANIPLSLKLRVWDGLAVCMKVTQSSKLMAQVVKQAMEMLRAAGPQELDAVHFSPAEYQFHFTSRLAECALLEGDVASAEAHLIQAIQYLEDREVRPSQPPPSSQSAVAYTSPLACLGLLHLAQLQLQQHKLKCSCSTLHAAERLVPGLTAAVQNDASISQWLPAFKLQLAVTQASHFVCSGYPDLEPTVDPARLRSKMEDTKSPAERVAWAHYVHMEDRYAEYQAALAADTPIQPVSLLPWSPPAPPLLTAMKHLTGAALLRLLGKTDASRQDSQEGVKAVSTELERLLVLHSPGASDSDSIVRQDEVGMSPEGVAHCTPYLRVYALLREEQVLNLMLTSNLEAALLVLDELHALLAAYPGVLASVLAPTTHVLTGMFLQTVGDVAAAVGHYERARTLRTGLDPMTRCLTCVAHLSHDLALQDAGSSDALTAQQQAMGVLGTLCDGCEGEDEESVARLEALAPSDYSKCVLMITAGLMSFTLGKDAEARRRLNRALKFAHKQFANHQLLALTLAVFAVVNHRAGDQSGANQMLSSGFALARAIADLPLQVLTLRNAVTVLESICAAEVGGTSSASKHTVDLQKRRPLLQARVGAYRDAVKKVVGGEETGQVVQRMREWGMMQA